MTNGVCNVCGRTARTSAGELEFCPDHTEADIPKSEPVQQTTIAETTTEDYG